MRKLLVCLLCLGLMVGCVVKKETPTSATETYLKEVKAKVNDELLNEYKELEEFELTGDLIKKLSDFSYKVVKEEINDKTATVDVEFTTYDFGKAFTVAFPEALYYSFTASLSGIDEATITEEISKIFVEEFNKAEKNFKATVTLILSQDENNKWVIEENKDLQNVVTGNLMKTVEDLNASFNPQ